MHSTAPSIFGRECRACTEYGVCFFLALALNKLENLHLFPLTIEGACYGHLVWPSSHLVMFPVYQDGDQQILCFLLIVYCSILILLLTVEA